MVVDSKWVARNLGFNPKKFPAPASTFTFKAAARAKSTEDLQREIIDFDSEAAAGREFLAFTTATGLSRFTEFHGRGARAEDRTRAEGTQRQSAAAGRCAGRHLDGRRRSRAQPRAHAGQGFPQRLSPVHAQLRFDLSSKMRNGCPAIEPKRLGAYWTTSIGKTSVVVFKSDSHMSQDGPQLPNIDVWKQIIAEVQPKLVLTTGTAGGIGKQFEVGDVVVSPIVRFDCISKFKSKPFAQAHYTSAAPNKKHFAAARSLFKVNAAQLPKDNTRPPKIFSVSTNALAQSVVTTDFFGFDTSDNHYHLQGLGDVSEMGDAVLGLVCSEMGANAPRALAVRNVSDPQIKAEGTI